MNDILIGVDAGGTKTVAAAYTQGGELLASQTGAAGNVAADTDAACHAIIKTVQALLRELNTPHTLPLLCVGAAGVSGGGETLSRALADAFGARFDHIRVISDAELALHAAHKGADGLLIIAGTGSIGYRKSGEHLLRAGGWGHLVGDEGSAYAVAVGAIRAVTQAADAGKEPPCALWAALQNALGIDTLSALISYVYSHPKTDIAALCRVVAECAQAGDLTARALLKQAGADLAKMAEALLSRDSVPHPLPLACSGGLLTGNAIVREVFEQELRSCAMPVSTVFDLTEPTRGVVSVYRDIAKGGSLL